MSEVIRFGPFEVDLGQHALRKGGARIRLQPQPFEVLIALLEEPGRIVTRDELRQRLWPGETFVDFEHGLNAALARLRQALSDSATTPRYIETVPKLGYRFSGTVERTSTILEREPPQTATLPAKSTLGRWIAALVFLVAIAVGAFFLVPRSAVLPDLRPAPLTAFRGHEINPALAPDGRRLAFTWDGDRRDNFDVYILRLDSRTLFRLTSDPLPDGNPCWSPDGSTIAFLRRSAASHGELFLIPASGGLEHKIADIQNDELRESPARLISLSWSPDGRWVAASHRGPEDSSECIYLFSRTGESRRLTSPGGFTRDEMPAFSADGRTLAFARLPGWSTSEIYAVSLDADFRSAGKPRRLTERGQWCVNPVWLSSGDRILYLASREPAAPLEFRVGAAAGAGNRGARLSLVDHPLEFALQGDKLVYTRQTLDTNIWRARISVRTRALGVPELVIASTRRDEKPRYSPDGGKVAFTSLRSGSAEIWVADADGSRPVQITRFGGPLVGYASWSPDGQWLLFHARPEGQADLFVIPAAGGAAKRLTWEPGDDVMPSYSRDGRSIYFSSSRTGRSEIWGMPVDGGEAVQLSHSGGYRPLEGPDGNIYYLSLEAGRIYRVHAGGGAASEVVAPLHRYPCGFDVTSRGVYYEAPPGSGGTRYIRFLSFATGENRRVAAANYAFYLGMSVSPDEKYVLFDQFDEFDRDLMLISDFRL